MDKKAQTFAIRSLAHHKPEYTMEKSAPKGTNPNVYSLALSVSRW